jgi:hypothetical protein
VVRAGRVASERSLSMSWRHEYVLAGSVSLSSDRVSLAFVSVRVGGTIGSGAIRGADQGRRRPIRSGFGASAARRRGCPGPLLATRPGSRLARLGRLARGSSALLGSLACPLFRLLALDAASAWSSRPRASATSVWVSISGRAAFGAKGGSGSAPVHGPCRPSCATAGRGPRSVRSIVRLCAALSRSGSAAILPRLGGAATDLSKKTGLIAPISDRGVSVERLARQPVERRAGFESVREEFGDATGLIPPLPSI